MNKLTSLKLDIEESFEANGVKYFVEEKLSFARYDYLSALLVRLAYGRDYDSINASLHRIKEYLDKIQFVKAAVEVTNVIEGIKAFPNRVDDAFAVCALFINAENEDRGIVSGEMIGKKIEDWKVGGLDAIPFQRLAASLCGDLLNDWKQMEGLESTEKTPDQNLSQPNKKE